MHDPLAGIRHADAHLQGGKQARRRRTDRPREGGGGQFPQNLRHADRAQPGEAIAVGRPRLAEEEELGPSQSVCRKRRHTPHWHVTREQADNESEGGLPLLPQGPKVLHAEP